MSALNDLLRLVRLRVEVYHNARVCGDWLIREHSEGNTCFHMPTQGDCRLTVPGHGEWHLAEGDLVLFPREIAHTMTPVGPASGPQRHLAIASAQDQPGTSMLCGEVVIQHTGNAALLDSLPPVFILPRTHDTAWLTTLLQLIVAESLASETPSNVVLDRLCELLFVFALRHYASAISGEPSLLNLYGDARLAKALRAVHADPRRDWQLETLAAEATMSRTRFAKAFRDLSGWTAMHYVTWWRMQLARSLLESGRGVADVADAVGYRSEAAFSRAFSKAFGTSAGAVRRAS
ncbi:MAG: AraC family transcriptional regulator [Pseudomonadota bacterium]